MAHVHTFTDAAGVQRVTGQARDCDYCRAPIGLDETRAGDLDYRFPAGPVTTALCWDQRDGLEPGDEGWWPVEGARAIDIRPGDLVMSGWRNDHDGSNGHAEYEVAEMASFTAPTMNTIRVGFIATTGRFASVGMLQPMALLRRGTHRTLAGSVR